MADLDYVKVVGRLGLTVVDSLNDIDDNPDTVWCNEGEVWFTPLTSVVKALGLMPSVATLSNGIIKAQIDADGYIGVNNLPYLKLVDLTTTKVNPYIPSGRATHQVDFKNIKANNEIVTFNSFKGRFANDMTIDGVCDLTLAAPMSTSTATGVVIGPQGPPGSSTVTQDPDHDGFFVLNN